MKPGAGDDPFAEDDQDDDQPADPSTTEVGDDVDESAAETTTEDGSTDVDPSTTPSDGGDDPTDDVREAAIPWVLRRSSVKQSRDNVHQFFLRDEYSRREDDIVEAVAELLDLRQKDVMKLDVREAMVATADPEAIAETLEEWGYEYKE